MLKIVRRTVGFVRCLFWPHEPNRRRVRKQRDGQHLSYCKHCGTPIRRMGYNQWLHDKKKRIRTPEPETETTTATAADAG